MTILAFNVCSRQIIVPKEDAMPDNAPRVSLKFVYSLCNDVGEVRKFYSDLLGMKEIAFYNDEDQKFGYLSYLCKGGLEFDFFYIGKEVPTHPEWAWQPGYEGGTLPVASWSVEIPEEDFPAAVKRLKEAGVKSLKKTLTGVWTATGHFRSPTRRVIPSRSTPFPRTNPNRPNGRVNNLKRLRRIYE
jgi:catechol 2,3-dioxygenase-like lactoylglutathione lyase family enzyme